MWQRAVRLGTGSLLCLGRHNVTCLISTTGKQHSDWSADYRVFERGRFREEMLFSVIRKEVTGRLEKKQPLVVLMDDTLFDKSGRNVYGTAFKRDPNGPKFCNNFIWATRYLQISGAVEEEERPGSCRGIPLMIRHCPTPKKPSRCAPAEVHAEYTLLREATKISKRGADAIRELREQMDPDRELVVSVDGGYTNKTVIRSLPEKTTLIGRARRDAKLYDIPVEKEGRRGRRSYYGEQLPTPEAIRKDDEIPWETVKAFASDRVHEFQVKYIKPVRSRVGGERNLSLLVIRPLRYRLKKGSPLIYRKPTYLICTDSNLPPEKILQWYLWRWQIEVNFRDEKCLLGIDEPSVRKEESLQFLPALMTVSYAFMQLAFTGKSAKGVSVRKLPKWRKHAPPGRMTTGLMQSEFRNQIWGLGIGSGNLPHFVKSRKTLTKSLKFNTEVGNAVYYAHR
ncbi:hypothetical protein CSA37_01790 [Candidatus Fermentibacteria bacterium]|nr:MAG: hypothetical protein CSA37_01790 [Candidatus Fermentibacteria bacterium]